MSCAADIQPWHWAAQSGDDCTSIMPDWILTGGDLGRDNGLNSLIIAQLFTDAMVNNKGGWWGDQFQPFPMGSEVWTLNGAKLNETATVDYERFVRESLEPLIAQGVFQLDHVRAAIVGKTIGVNIQIETSVGEPMTQTFQI